MSLSARIERLRKLSLEAKPWISPERAQLITQFYREDHKTVSAPICRALVFKHLLENKKIYIGDGEVIVGEKGPAPKAVPTYPELCCHSLEDLEILNSREKVSFAVSEETRRIYAEEIIPFWKGRSMRELIFSDMAKEWKDAFAAGVFTEFMEQRAPGHTVLDNKIYHQGMLDFKRRIEERIASLDYLNDPDAYDKKQELTAMGIAADALIRYAQRHAERARELAATERDPVRKRELKRIAEVCIHIPAYAPRDFWEAIQYYWFVHLGVTLELNTWDAFSPGRLDQHLYPFYQRGVADGTLTLTQAEELLQCLWIKFHNQPAPPKVGVTAEESATYTDFVTVDPGGLTPEGEDAVNELSYLILDVVEEMRLIQPNARIQVSKKNPDRFLKRAAEIIRTGFGQPSIFNADAIVQELLRQGKSIVDARCGGSSGCVETGAYGKESYILTGYFNMPKVLEITLNNRVDPRTGKRIGLETGDPRESTSFEELFSAYERQLNYFIDIKICGNNVIERLYAKYMPSPFLSILIDDCIETGKDYHVGGARYNSAYIQGVGLGTMTDSMTAIKYHVFDRKDLTMDELLATLESNFAGNEPLRQLLLNKTPKYGNDDDYADDIMKLLFDAYFNAIDGRPNTKGGHYRINLLPTTVHVYFGSVLGATPDGRQAGTPLSEGISPVQGADRRGPTATLKSAAKIDHLRTGGTLLNQKLTPKLLADSDGLDKFVKLVRTYFRLDGHHVQYNVIDAATLRAAQQSPEKYRDLIVRVAGYSDYFCNLSKALQDEIVARTDHDSF
ncbi:glycyl radical protein [Candidatus Bipolaricaulota bacterium]|nr:glycyl radical protein [Candidatus Bipolaricaulota bacterium]